MLWMPNRSSSTGQFKKGPSQTRIAFRWANRLLTVGLHYAAKVHEKNREVLSRSWGELGDGYVRIDRWARRSSQALPISEYPRVRWLVGAFQGAIEKFSPDDASDPITLREAVAGVIALGNSFARVEWGTNEGAGCETLRCTTRPITLVDEQGTSHQMGTFTVVLLMPRGLSPYRLTPTAVIRVEGGDNPSPRDEGVTHPHVNDELLCWGRGLDPATARLQEGRLWELPLIALGVLTTYNPRGPYIRLEEWDGHPCEDCGATLDEDESGSCVECENTFCRECLRYCDGCEHDYCSRHADFSSCNGCDRSWCSGCTGDWLSCDDCGDYFCDRCYSHCETCTGMVCEGCCKQSPSGKSVCASCDEKERENADEQETEGDSAP